MKSRYAPLVKLKKKDLDQAERSLIAANNEAAAAAERLNASYATLSTLSLPTHGTAHELSQANLIIQTQQGMIERCKENLASAHSKQSRMRDLFNRAMIEYEKFKYLEVQEMNERMIKLKHAEAKMLDEIGIMTYHKEAL